VVIYGKILRFGAAAMPGFCLAVKRVASLPQPFDAHPISEKQCTIRGGVGGVGILRLERLSQDIAGYANKQCGPDQECFMSASSFGALSRSLRLLALGAAVATLPLSGCASGPSDFVRMTKAEPAKNGGPVIRDQKSQQALVASLSSQRGREAGAERTASTDAATVLALTAARQQQTDEAKALLMETGALGDAPACPAADGATPANCPAPVAQ
jgi:hypothetical protein